MHAGHKAYRKQQSKRIGVGYTLTAALKCEGFDRIYFPHHLDFRGRFYAIPEHLNPQGPDYSRALLTFAEGQPIAQGSNAERWLLVHGANQWGKGSGAPVNKLSFDNRETVMQFMGEDVLKYAAQPLIERGWMAADDPWQFLAFCFEWQEYKQHGDGYLSHLPISLDGTCNGLQHFAAMMRDEVSARATNLMPSPRTGYIEPWSVDEDGEGEPVHIVEGAQDLYQHVADLVTARVLFEDYVAWLSRKLAKKPSKSSVAGEATKHEDADKLVALAAAGRIDRKLVKSHVMTLPYGKTPFGRLKTLAEDLREGIWPDAPFAPIMFLRDILTGAIEESVPAAKTVMEWLTKLGTRLADVDKPITWQTPSGFRITQHYRSTKSRQVKIRALHGITISKIQTLSLMFDARESDPMDSAKQATALAPNFVHSLDASALAETVLLAAQHGLKSFAMIHDSYGTTAAQTDTLVDDLRASFAALYREHDVLAEVRDRVVAVLGAADVPDVPARGEFKIEDVLRAEFFFS